MTSDIVQLELAYQTQLTHERKYTHLFLCSYTLIIRELTVAPKPEVLRVTLRYIARMLL
jgi:hypothetical protein